MASAARMVLKPSSHSSITGRRRCSHSNVAGGWTLLRTLGAPLTVARCTPIFKTPCTLGTTNFVTASRRP